MAVERAAATQVRQGDVLLTPQLGINAEQLTRILQDGRDLINVPDTAVLAVGVGGGHPHEVVGEGISFVESNHRALLRQQPDDQVSRLLYTGENGATLRHDEHEPIELPAKAMYIVFRQLETLVGDDNNPNIHQTSGVINNDRGQPSRRYVED